MAAQSGPVEGDPAQPDHVEARPGRAAALALLALAVLLAVLSATADVAGALLCAPAAAVALGLGLRDLLLVPVLQADAAGLRVVTGLRHRTLSWDDVVTLRTVTDRRAVLLEMELVHDEVLLLSRNRLGRDPRDVLEQLRQLRARR